LRILTPVNRNVRVIVKPKFWFWIQMNFYLNPDGPALLSAL
jgi:hypothetical protein